MRLAPDESLEAFRHELEQWLDANMPSAAETGEPRRSSGHLPQWAREWQRRMFDTGWLIPGYPPEYGGRNASPQEQLVYFEVLISRQVPRGLNPQGLSICAPTLIDHGTAAQIENYAIPTLKGEKTGCVGMSEPGAGSDLAGLATRAVLDGDHFVVNGQKVWTSGAHEADYMTCFVRTDPDAPKHKGISVLVIDMASNGIECRPLAELTDPHHVDFNEVFFTDVHVTKENLVGQLNGGWALAQGSLGHERSMLWIMNAATLDRAVEGLVRLAAREDGAGRRIGDDPRFAEHLAELAMDAKALWCLGYRGFSKTHPAAGPGSRVPVVPRQKGQVGQDSKPSAAKPAAPPPEHVILKLFSSEAEQKAKLLGMEALGAGALDLDGPGPYRQDDIDHQHFGEPVEPVWVNPFSDGPWAVEYLRSFAGTIAGGTSEIQRSIIAERVLGLPRS